MIIGDDLQKAEIRFRRDGALVLAFPGTLVEVPTWDIVLFPGGIWYLPDAAGASFGGAPEAHCHYGRWEHRSGWLVLRSDPFDVEVTGLDLAVEGDADRLAQLRQAHAERVRDEAGAAAEERLALLRWAERKIRRRPRRPPLSM